MYEDKTLVCKECGAEFVFTAGEQEFYAEKGFQNEPQRCKACRDARKADKKADREMFTAVCAGCGKEAKVPFRPREDRPVYCSESAFLFASVFCPAYLERKKSSSSSSCSLSACTRRSSSCISVSRFAHCSCVDSSRA